MRTTAHEGREVVPGLLGKPRKGLPRIGGIEILPDDPSGTVRPELIETREDRERDKVTPPLIVARPLAGALGHVRPGRSTLLARP